MTIAHNQIGPCIELERSRKCGCVPQGESDVDIALGEALGNAILHGNPENPRKRVYIRCRCEPDGVPITTKDEGKGFDISRMSDPTAPQNIASVHCVAST